MSRKGRLDPLAAMGHDWYGTLTRTFSGLAGGLLGVGLIFLGYLRATSSNRSGTSNRPLFCLWA